jgi:prepilin-type N-terminal cleavage/methylation domain-containing protein
MLINQKKQGFTLMEVMAVIGVATVGLFGVSSLVVQNIQAQNVNRHYPVAAMLAQEGVELVRNQRDNNWLAGLDWMEKLDDDGSFTIDYRPVIDSIPNQISQNGTELKQNADGFFDYDINGVDTVYKRIVFIDYNPLINADFADVTVTVQWNDRGRDYDYVLRHQLYDWR